MTSVTSSSIECAKPADFRCNRSRTISSNALWASFDNAEGRLAGRERHVKRRYRLAETFQCQAAEVFEWDYLLYRGGDTTADQNLTVFRFGAEPSGEVAHRPNCCVARALGKADLTQGRITLGDAHTEAQITITAAPGGNQTACGRAHSHRHVDRAVGRVGGWDGIVEEDHDAIARELIERPLVFRDEWPQRAVVFAQEVEHLFGLGGLGEGGVAAQIAKHDDDLAAMAFEDFLVALRDDQLGELRREKPLQSPDAAQLFDLLSDPRVKTTIEFGDLLGALAKFAEEPRVLDCDDRLRREILQQRDLLVAKGSTFLTSNGDRADCHTVAEHG